jgi:SHS2 domain-containing protein
VTAVWEDHPGEEQLCIVAATPEQVIREAAVAFGRLVAREPDGIVTERSVALEAHDRAGLLIAFMGELVYLADTEGFVPEDVTVEMTAQALHATISGRLTSIAPLVKAATYHGLSFEQRGGSWHARIVLDV